jgi:hypothetical protein
MKAYVLIGGRGFGNPNYFTVDGMATDILKPAKGKVSHENLSLYLHSHSYSTSVCAYGQVR